MAVSSPQPRVPAFVAVIALSALAAITIGYTAYGTQMNAYAYDLFFRLRPPETRQTGRIVIVAVDDATLRARGMLPLDRRLMAQALEKICSARPSVVGIDVWFAEPGPPEADAALERALAGCPHAVLSTALVPELGGGTGPNRTGWREPLPALAGSAAAIGHVHADPDPDGVNRQVLLEKVASGTRHWALALECLRLLEEWPVGAPTPIIEKDDGLEVGDRRIPASRRDQRALLVNYAGPAGTFPEVSFNAVLEGSVRPAVFARKAVLLGTTARGVGDRLFTPFSSSGIGMPGVEIHANLLDTLLEQSYLRPLRESTVVGLLLAFAAAAGAALYFLRGARLVTAAGALIAAAHLLPYALVRAELFHAHWVAPAFSLAASVWLPLASGGTYQYFAVWRGYLRADATQRRLRDHLELVTHEMRSPLTAIQGSSELMRRYPLDEERRRQMADLIHRESERLSRLVERFLDVERLSAGELELKRAPVEVRAVAESSAERVRLAAERKRINVEVVVEDSAAAPLEALGDVELLEFAVYNLLSNAVKYSPEGGRVRLAVRGSGVGKEDGSVLVEVEDQGAGIPAEEAARIFDRFYRTRAAQVSGHPGLGLGLAIVREIARHHGGEVTVESQPGRGSKFTLALPLAARKTAAIGLQRRGAEPQRK